MASNPTDLIREADYALRTDHHGLNSLADPEDLVRRLRDALEASEFERDRFENARAAAVVKCADVTIERDQARAALAEANATIARVRALADEWMGDGANPRSLLKRIAGMALRRAIEGPAT